MKCSQAHIHLVDRLTAGPQDANTPDSIAIGNDLDRHLASCADCRATFADMSASLAAWKSDKPWAPPDSYWNNLLPGINARIAEREQRRANPLTRLASIARWLVVPIAALTVMLVLTNQSATVTYPTTQEIAAVVHALPDNELTSAIDHQQWESQFTSSIPDTSSLSMTDADQQALAEILNDETTQLSVLPLSAAPLSTIQTENDGALFASADDMFDAIQPRLERSIASITH